MKLSPIRLSTKSQQFYPRCHVINPKITRNKQKHLDLRTISISISIRVAFILLLTVDPPLVPGMASKEICLLAGVISSSHRAEEQ